MTRVESCHRVMSLDYILCFPLDSSQKGSSLPCLSLPSPTCSYNSDDDTTHMPISLYNYPKMANYHSPMDHHSHHRPVVARRYQRPRKSLSRDSIGAGIIRGPGARVAWTPDEDELLKQGYEQGLSWAMIVSTYLPHRSRGCCWCRLKTLKNKKSLTTQNQLWVKTRPWKTFQPLAMQQQS
ncbi:hypothetical protein BC941DRAFT_425244 [Chlamydoabsidia padenii]|nr:hypothetical protein BC941DRAFT_425244 [Chlamydoabsidia padenii]